MTREEAVEILKKNRPGADPRRCGLELCTAVDVAIAALREQPQWISVEERLPDDSFLEKEIIICVLNRFGERKVYTKKFWGVNSALWNNDTTHWMPLPEPPEEEV